MNNYLLIIPVTPSYLELCFSTVKILNSRTDRGEKTGHTQIRLLLFRVYITCILPLHLTETLRPILRRFSGV